MSMAEKRREEEEQAIAWAIRGRDADAETWASFTVWLEGSPARLAAYDRVTLAGDGLMDAPRGVSVASPTRAWYAGRRSLVAGAAAAAVLLAIAGRVLVPSHAGASYRIATRVGAQRAVTLGDGTRIALAGGAQLLLTRGDARHARLVAGSARFHVAHDASAPFEVALGDVRVRDVGTDFVLTRADGRSEVAVVDGAVLYDPAGAGLRLSAGDRIVDPDGAAPIERSRADPASIGGWAEGELVFREASFATVADELSHATGLAVAADPALGGHRFTGRIALDGDMRALRRRVAALLDVAVRPVAGGWRLAPPDRAAP